MTLEELLAREQVRDVYARYNHAGDRGRLEQLAECFAPDGTLEVKNRFTVTGRQEIISVLGAMGERLGRSDVPPAGRHHILRHYVANLVFTSVRPDRIETASYYVVFRVDAADHWGRYRDVLVPVDGKWLFYRRLVTVDGWDPSSKAGI
ncbi:hypothetical protein MGALJ_30100 [Mycobacterium gallinarum]|uniref:SnoaL-like domain-containing protein n=1 Tax=Mycobacterium gallinarum TaxID=39689 RepID=A0A9W4FFT7_9MYCO|nr:nuclear transport factor 2 family protein [Mycobacterium gallinarum]BBY93341.1 hypothetical protein MGALJ_30100 [Mycobacterium gallinarum]